LYVAKQEGKHLVARKTYVNVSKTYNNVSMIESGLSLGDQIITEGFSQVVNGSLISTK
jgi:multidrug efflux pump subunit AcrA (membrane-fusion protein)